VPMGLGEPISMSSSSYRAGVFVSLILSAIVSLPAFAQAPEPQLNAVPQITQAVDESSLTTLRGNTHPLAQPHYDQGILPDSTPAHRMLLVLRRAPETDAAVRQYIDDIHHPASANYHQWLKPAGLGALYGPADQDIQQVAAWLGSHGFSIDRIHPGKTVLEFSGTTGQVRQAFHTEIHRYSVNGELHNANSSDPQIPQALAPVIAGFASLSDFHPQSNLKVLGTAQYSTQTHQANPQWTYPASSKGVIFALAPGDFKVQYDVPSTSTGAGYTIGVIGASNVNVALVNTYRTAFGLPANPLQVVVDGEDPGQNGANTESYLDVEVAGSVAPAANVVLYTSADSELTDGLLTAATRAVDDDTADVLTMSYGECEKNLGTTNLFFYQLWQQAAAQGQTVMVSAGDGGAAACDNFDSATLAQNGVAVSGFASTPYNVAVGGTDFYYSAYNQGSTAFNAQIFSYWNSTSATTPTTSILKTVPEQPWDDPLGLNVNPYSRGIGIVAGSGGPSNCSSEIVSSMTCTGGYPKPTWQSGTGVPADGVRDLPDLSLFAGDSNYSFWPICAASDDCTTITSTGATNITGVSGTSAASPAFAGIMALVVQATKSRQGQANYRLYPLAAQQPAVFHDITVGSNKVPCLASTGDLGCADDSTQAVYDLGYSATAGYDLATGLGSVDVTQLIADWNKVAFTASSTSLTLSPASITHGQNVTVTAKVAPGLGTGTPTGAVALTATLPGATSSTGLGSFALTAGALSTTLQSLPGGTYTVYANYAGDSTFAASQSTGSSITVLPQASSIVLNAYNGLTIPFGSYLAILAKLSPNSGGSNSLPTGAVTFADSAGGQAVFPLNSSGVAEWDTFSFALGAHTITATYGGDASFNPTTTPPAATFTIVKGTPKITFVLSATTVASGGSLTVQVAVDGNNGLLGTAPSGSVVLTLGTQQQTVALTSAAGSGVGSAVFTNLPAGTLTLLATYAGDSNWTSISTLPRTISVTPTVPTLVSTTTLTSSSSTLNGSNGQVLLTATVQGTGSTAAPTGTVIFYVAGLIFAEFTLTPAASGPTAFAEFDIPGNDLPNGIDSLVASYSGSAVYSPSTSAALTLNDNSSDFALNALAPSVTIAAGSSATASLELTSSGVAGAVTITCAPSSTAITCTPAATSPTLTATSQAAASVIIAAFTSTGSNTVPARPFAPLYPGGIALACVLLFALPPRRPARKALLALLLLAAAAWATGCGGGGGTSSTTTGGGSSGGGGSTPVVTNAPAATYSVVVTATVGGTTHDVRLTVNVH
jgi:trimeric autotransporter adhesin